MRVLVVTTEFNLGTTGGVESVVKFMLSAMLKYTDWTVEVASLRMSRRARESRRLLDPLSWFKSARTTTQDLDGTTVYQVGCSAAELEFARYMPRPWLTSLTNRADIVVVVSGSPAVAFAVRHARKPVVVQVATLARFERTSQLAARRGLDAFYHRASTCITNQIDLAGLAVADLVLVENSQMVQICEDQHVQAWELLPPGVDTEKFRPGPKGATPGYVLMVGRLADARKNIGDLIRAFAEAREVYGISQNLVLAGLSQPRPNEIGLIRELGLDAVVQIISPVPDEDLVRLYQGADVFASTSHEEGLGIAFLEAMACGIPVITTNTAGALLILGESRAGTIVSHGPGFVGRFAKELAHWCGDAKLRARAGAMAREEAVAAYSTQHLARRFIDAFRRVSGKSGGV